MSIITQLRKLLRSKPQIIVIAGQTSAGKSELAVALAKEINGEIVSADSRQVYKGLDLASGKITPQEMQGVPHHMIDIVSPTDTYSVSEYVKDATKSINDILDRGKVPIICGGTGFYIDALVYKTRFSEVPANKKLRKEFENTPTERLFERLTECAPKRAREIGADNKQRIIRALEIYHELGKIPQIKKKSPYRALWICAERDRKDIKSRIKNRILKRIDNGMIQEIQGLMDAGVTHARLNELGLECRYISRFLQGTIDRETMITELTQKTNQFAKRQRTWFKRNPHYHWLHPEKEKSYIIDIAKEFLKQ
jgi:tRNA dimethylallyltransferase